MNEGNHATRTAPEPLELRDWVRAILAVGLAAVSGLFPWTQLPAMRQTMADFVRTRGRWALAPARRRGDREPIVSHAPLSRRRTMLLGALAIGCVGVGVLILAAYLPLWQLAGSISEE